MTTRKLKVEELLADMRLLRRSMAFKTSGAGRLPRVTPSQWGVLMLIEQHGTSTVKEVAQALGVTSSAATQLVDGLVTSGYLLRKSSTQDRRIVTLTLSTKSKTQVNRMKKHAVEGFLKIFEALSDKEFDQYVALNKKLVQRSLIKKSI
jgi:DNA-binding MarR family transcriptional regulator